MPGEGMFPVFKTKLLLLNGLFRNKLPRQLCNGENPGHLEQLTRVFIFTPSRVCTYIVKRKACRKDFMENQST